MQTRTIILATRNPGKLREIQAILRGLTIRIAGLDGFPAVPEIDETGETLEENALIKARTVHGLTGLPAISDDSGLEVDFLGGAPGVRSARFAGEDATYDDNNRKLLSMLSGVPEAARRARFRTVAAYVWEGGEHLTEGCCEGRIATSIKGMNGFGYDPIFIPDGFSTTFAEIPPEIKNTISHRSIAFAAMGRYLAAPRPDTPA
jgi:XTP/dITP diphosphohydrolase